ncbi:MAG: septum formation inhibitor [Bacteroidetes bacterium HGW-Bacteroidetes-17]|jgi:hypothetical protein|nr:MAG: septum formation inhibitor [Bacteroidetes bacterium HGW-Bacteroidetes-17]
MFRKIFNRINNKYFYAGVLFLVWIFFFDNNNLISRFKSNKTLNDARRQKEFYKSEIKRDLQTIDDLLHDSAAIEKFGREQYLMKRDSEDIFLVVTKKDDNK